jgi:hypothetical protein
MGKYIGEKKPNNRYYTHRVRKARGEYINMERPAYVDMLVERADKYPYDMKLQEGMLSGKVPHLTRTERKRFRARVNRAKKRWKRELDKSGVPQVAHDIKRIINRY